MLLVQKLGNSKISQLHINIAISIGVAEDVSGLDISVNYSFWMDVGNCTCNGRNEPPNIGFWSVHGHGGQATSVAITITMQSSAPVLLWKACKNLTMLLEKKNRISKSMEKLENNFRFFTYLLMVQDLSVKSILCSWYYYYVFSHFVNLLLILPILLIFATDFSYFQSVDFIWLHFTSCYFMQLHVTSCYFI